MACTTTKKRNSLYLNQLMLIVLYNENKVFESNHTLKKIKKDKDNNYS